MKTTVKHKLIIFHNPYEWLKVSERLKEEYGQSIMLLSSKCRRELGFTVRHHKGLVPNEHESEWLEEEFRHKYHYEPQVHLDFYNEAQMSFFVLKYLDN